MQSQKYSKRLINDDQNLNSASDGNPVYNYFFVTDPKGIQLTFEQLKSELEKELDDFITVIYLVPREQSTPLYSSELDILEYRFIYKLLIYYIYYDYTNFTDQKFSQKILEVLINSNTQNVMHFAINGDKNLVDFTSEMLLFLGINEANILSQAF